MAGHDEVEWMARAHALAARALLLSDPNPRVGCVLVRDGQIVGEGWTHRPGGVHAEVCAIQAAGSAGRGATAYVTLEPCAHIGRTGACTEALIQAGVAEVVYAVEDPNPQVSGAGAEALREAGIQVRRDAFGLNSAVHNPGYFRRWSEGLPWVRLKTAASLDGRTALADGSSRWITGSEARQDVQFWRARSSAVLTGIGTVLADDPQLNVRLGGDYYGDEEAPQPLRVILDSQRRTPPAARILGLPGRVLLAHIEGAAQPPAFELDDHVEAAAYPAAAGDGGGIDLERLLRDLARRGCNEVHVEAGATLAGALLAGGWVDEWIHYTAPTVLGSDAAPLAHLPGLQTLDEAPRWQLLSVMMVGADARLLMRRGRTQ
ncbi:MAG: bifunctional diaminohydroxyphosphoribosylaminopyrimidine deaminase/5-amino-6-(5-phosphoribosylamino)uracil reductase RibD [Gammaproteobacteria bacterium AqS3]|nr:bifunctional diaminohydroxyphosphoribosylaminopyrimidine deaminase/5-amino-6-(5-phosphoribosylamino)uracil reductase RibD [Gammaproteobacteria bacterium AqS3]